MYSSQITKTVNFYTKFDEIKNFNYLEGRNFSANSFLRIFFRTFVEIFFTNWALSRISWELIFVNLA